MLGNEVNVLHRKIKRNTLWRGIRSKKQTVLKAQVGQIKKFHYSLGKSGYTKGEVRPKKSLVFTTTICG